MGILNLLKFLTRGFLYTIAEVFLIIILSMIWPFQKVKFLSLLSRIGDFSASTEIFIRRRKTGYYDQDCLYIGVNQQIFNEQLFKMYQRIFPIIDNKYFYRIINMGLFKKTVFYEKVPWDSNEYYEFSSLPSNLVFTQTEEQRGLRELEKMGIGPNDWFVCFHARDSSYLNKVAKGYNWSHHDYRDCDINNFLKAAEYITRQGGYAIRMGAVVEKPLPELNNAKIIDYSTMYRSDFMDIYLCAKCKFFIGTDDGLSLIPMVFDVPVINTNVAMLEWASFRKNDLYILKKYMDREKNRTITFSEILQRKLGLFFEAQKYEEHNIELIENSAQEILYVTREMNERLDEKFLITDEDEKLQEKFRSFFKPHHLSYKSTSRIGTAFLRENRKLLV